MVENAISDIIDLAMPANKCHEKEFCSSFGPIDVFIIVVSAFIYRTINRPMPADPCDCVGVGREIDKEIYSISTNKNGIARTHGFKDYEDYEERCKDIDTTYITCD